MPERPKLGEALKRVLELSYPPTTLTLPPSRAVGHRLASAVQAKASLPSRPFALVDGLAVYAADIVAPRRQGEAKPDAEEQEVEQSEPEGEASAEAPAGNGDLADKMVLTTDYSADANTEAVHEDAPEDIEQLEYQSSDEDSALGTATLTLRPMPTSNRREDALQPGQAIPVPVGGEVPRGGELIIPLHEIAGELDEDYPSIDPSLRQARDTAIAAAAEARARQAQTRPRRGEQRPEIEDPDDEALPALEPSRDWDLIGRHQHGEIELSRLARRPDANMVPIGGWMRSRQEVLPAKTLIRAGELALLEALSIDEVEIYRKPVVGVASLSPPMPHAQRKRRRTGASTDFPVTGGGPGDRDDELLAGEIDPLAVLALQLCRTAQVAALPLGFAPLRFRSLVRAVEVWLEQVDVLLLVGGSHLGPRGLGQDVIAALGEIKLAGLDLEPGGSASTGMVGGKPVFALPGSLPDVLAGIVLLARPLLHKYNAPQHFEDQLEVIFEGADRLSFARDTLLPVRLKGFEDGMHARVSGSRRDDVWLRYIRGHALALLEGGREYADGERVPAWVY